jgi:tetratricopeptide (TPR) repeat protein
LLEPFVKAVPAADRARLFLALGYAREEKYEQGRTLAEQAAAALARDHYAHYVLGLNFFGLNRFDDAEGAYRRALELKPDFADAHFQLGQLYARTAEGAEQARLSFVKALEAGYTTAELYKNLAAVNIRLGRHMQAIEYVNAALKLDADYADAYFLLADAHRKLGQAQAALDAMRQFQALNEAATARREGQTRSRALYEEGMRLLDQDKLAEAYKAFRSASEAFPQLDAAHYRVAQIDYLRGDNRGALESIRRAIQINPIEAEYYFVLSRCLEDADLAAATEAAAKAAALNPSVADFHNLLGNLYSKAEEWARAVESYKRAVAIDPRNEAFKANLAAAQRRVP